MEWGTGSLPCACAVTLTPKHCFAFDCCSSSSRVPLRPAPLYQGVVGEGGEQVAPRRLSVRPHQLTDHQRPLDRDDGMRAGAGDSPMGSLHFFAWSCQALFVLMNCFSRLFRLVDCCRRLRASHVACSPCLCARSFFRVFDLRVNELSNTRRVRRPGSISRRERRGSLALSAPIQPPSASRTIQPCSRRMQPPQPHQVPRQLLQQPQPAQQSHCPRGRVRGRAGGTRAEKRERETGKKEKTWRRAARACSASPACRAPQ